MQASDVADFAGLALDIARGVRAVEELIERSELDRDCESLDGRALPTLDAQQVSDLRRLTLTALATLQERAAEIVRQADPDMGSTRNMN